jgi:hypothetical protein
MARIMSALRIFATGRPSLIGAPVRPMSRLDAEFWRIRAERKAAAHEGRSAAASATTAIGHGD